MNLKIIERLLFVILIVAAAAVSLAAQDLGSSNKLFREKNTAAKPEKKAAAATKLRKTKAKTTRTEKAAARPVIRALSKPIAKTPVRIAPRKVATTAAPVPSYDRATISQYLDLVTRGNDEMRRGSLPEAESLFEHAAAIAPGKPDAFSSLGRLYSDSLRWGAAEKAYRAAFELAPTDPMINLGLSRALAQPVVSADLYARYEEAERLARTAVRLSGTASAYDGLGMTLELRGLLGPETESAYRQAIGADRHYAPAYAHLARLLRRKGKAAEATSAYASATANAVDAAQMTAVAASFQSEQRYEESVPLLITALHIEPGDYRALVLLGRAQSVTGDLKSAEEHLLMATRLSPFSFAAFAELGRLYIRQSKAELALSTLDHSAQLADRFERLELARDLESLGDLFAGQGHPNGAATAYTRSLTLDAERPSTVEKLARIRR